MFYGEGEYCFEPVENWGIEAKEKWPDITEIAGISVDWEDNVYLLTRTQPPVIKMSPAGEILEWFGEGVFVRPHGIFRDKDGTIYGVDDRAHAVYRFNDKRELEYTFGTKGVPSDTGCPEDGNYKCVTHGGAPFNRPTRLVIDREGYIYITDGYRNARVHKFKKAGTLVKSWGEPGEGPGQFNLPHGIGIDSKDRLYVADRQNHRVQIFTTEGEYLDEWHGFDRPSDIWVTEDDTIYVSDCKRTSVFNEYPSALSIFNTDGQLLCRIDQGGPNIEGGPHRCAHGMAVDSKGDLYIAEVGKILPKDFYGVRKYRRVYK